MDFKVAFELTKDIKKVKGVISVVYPGAAASKTLNTIDLIVVYSNKSETSVHEVENLLNDKNSLSNKDFKNIGINKPTTPTQPKEPSSLIKDEKKDIKEIRK